VAAAPKPGPARLVVIDHSGHTGGEAMNSEALVAIRRFAHG
jgi:hypothetical protein